MGLRVVKYHYIVSVGKGRQLTSDVKGLFSSAESGNRIFIGTYLPGFVISPAALGRPYV